jgi:oligosaccharide repeat unit polymerase
MQDKYLRLSKPDIRVLLACTTMVIVYLVAYFTTYAPPELYLFCVCLVYASGIPERILHPKNILFAYHFIWYAMAPIYAPRYKKIDFCHEEEVYCYCMIACTYIIGFLCFHFFTKTEKSEKESTTSVTEINKIPVWFITLFFILLTLFSCIVSASLTPVGLIGYMQNPGEAFSSRDGAGPFTILLIFSSGVMFTLGSYYFYRYKHWHNRLFVSIFFIALVFFVLLFLTGRGRMLSFLLFLFVPYFFTLRFSARNVSLISAMGLFSVVFGSYLRGTQKGAGGKLDLIIQIALNYFDTFEALYKVVKYEPPALFSTIFLGFNKFFVPYGFTRDFYYMLSYKLTPKYYPGYGNRTTVQFPVEADLYLSLYYWFGIPLLILYFFSISYIYRKAVNTQKLGWYYTAALLQINMVSNLRGQLINWTDIYLYPIAFVSLYILNHRNIILPEKYKLLNS